MKVVPICRLAGCASFHLLTVPSLYLALLCEETVKAVLSWTSCQQGVPLRNDFSEAATHLHLAVPGERWQGTVRPARGRARPRSGLLLRGPPVHTSSGAHVCQRGAPAEHPGRTGGDSPWGTHVVPGSPPPSSSPGWGRAGPRAGPGGTERGRSASGSQIPGVRGVPAIFPSGSKRCGLSLTEAKKSLTPKPSHRRRWERWFPPGENQTSLTNCVSD